MAEPPLGGRLTTVVDAMDAAADQFADAEAYIEEGRRITFREWIHRSDQLAAALVERGVRVGDVVAIMLPPSIDYAIAYAAGVRVGAVVTGINTRLGSLEVDAILKCCRPALVLVSAGSRPSQLPSDQASMDSDEITATERGAALTRPHRGRPSDPAVIVWTSGTTGIPKGAWFDHDNLRAAVTSAGIMTDPFDRRLASTPFAHAGYMLKVWEQLAWVTTLVISPIPWRASDMLRLIVEERITVAGAVPTQWERLLDEPGLATADLSSLRLGVAATAPASPELVARVSEVCGCPLVVRYAMTESPSITGTEPADPPEVLYRTVGRPQAGVEVSIRGGDGVPPGEGQVGRIHVRGACVMRGYWQEPQLTGEVLDASGWLRTGDLGYLDHDGNLVLAGRLDDMYIRGGYNVHPLEVEHVLAEHPAVAEVAVVGVPAEDLGKIGVAYVVPNAVGAPPSLAVLRSWCRERLADYKAPDRLQLVDSLPLTSMMKVDKAALLARGLPATD